MAEVAMCLNAKGGMGRIDAESETFIIDLENLGNGGNVGWRDGTDTSITLNTGGNIGIAHALRADGFDASEDGTGRGTPLVAAPLMYGSGNPAGHNARSGHCKDSHIVPVPFDTTQITSVANYSHPKPGDPCHPLASAAHAPAVAFQEAQTGCREYETAGTLRADGPGHDPVGTRVRSGMSVRRLTPRECERLQGFPDNYTLIPYRGKAAKDGPRYRALGNSFAVPVVRWIGERIAAVEAIRNI